MYQLRATITLMWPHPYWCIEHDPTFFCMTITYNNTDVNKVYHSPNSLFRVNNMHTDTQRAINTCGVFPSSGGSYTTPPSSASSSLTVEKTPSCR